MEHPHKTMLIEPGKRLVVGKMPASNAWQQSAKIQRTLGLMLKDRFHPKGVFRFKTEEDFHQWKQQITLSRADHQNRKTL